MRGLCLSTKFPHQEVTIIYSVYSALFEEMGSIHKAPKFKMGDRFRITKYKNIFSKVYNENLSQEILMIDYSVSKTSPSTYKIKDLSA